MIIDSLGWDCHYITNINIIITMNLIIISLSTAILLLLSVLHASDLF